VMPSGAATPGDTRNGAVAALTVTFGPALPVGPPVDAPVVEQCVPAGAPMFTVHMSGPLTPGTMVQLVDGLPMPSRHVACELVPDPGEEPTPVKATPLKSCDKLFTFSVLIPAPVPKIALPPLALPVQLSTVPLWVHAAKTGVVGETNAMQIATIAAMIKSKRISRLSLARRMETEPFDVAEKNSTYLP
jgi:hypothetical protein